MAIRVSIALALIVLSFGIGWIAGTYLGFAGLLITVPIGYILGTLGGQIIVAGMR